MTTPTLIQIQSLRSEAIEHGDPEMIDICTRAIAGDEEALEQCAEVIADAIAMADYTTDEEWGGGSL